jgi:hypothetical protein
LAGEDELVLGFLGEHSGVYVSLYLLELAHNDEVTQAFEPDLLSLLWGEWVGHPTRDNASEMLAYRFPSGQRATERGNGDVG